MRLLFSNVFHNYSGSVSSGVTDIECTLIGRSVLQDSEM